MNGFYGQRKIDGSTRGKRSGCAWIYDFVIIVRLYRKKQLKIAIFCDFITAVVDVIQHTKWHL